MGQTACGQVVHSDLALDFPSYLDDQFDSNSSRTHRILCYGDSLTAGFYNNGTRFSPYGKALEGALSSFGIDCEVCINGLSGHRADQMVEELDSDTCRDVCGKFGKGLAHILDNDGPYDLVILMAGTNDFTPDTDLRSIQASVCKLHNACHSRGVPTVMLAAPCNAPNLQVGLSRALSNWAHRQADVLCFLDPEQELPRSNRTFWETDQVHFTPAGSRALGLSLAPKVIKILEQLDEVVEFLESPKQKISSFAAMPRYLARGGA